MATGVFFDGGTGGWDAQFATNWQDGWTVIYQTSEAYGIRKGDTTIYWGGNFVFGPVGPISGIVSSFYLYDEGVLAYQVTGASINIQNFLQYPQSTGNNDRSAVMNNSTDYYISHKPVNLFWRLGNGDDTLMSSIGSDTVYGDAGNDYINGGGDADLLYGGTGFDTLIGESSTTTGGRDSIYAGDGNNYIEGGGENDYIEAGSGADIVYGGAGSDTISSENGNDYIFGDYGYAEFGNDNIAPFAGNDTTFAGQGNDSITDGDGDDVAVGGNGDDTISGGRGQDYLYGDLGAEEIGNDTIYGGEDTDVIFGGRGADSIEGQWGLDYLFGGDGADTIRGGYSASERDFFWYSALSEFGDVITDFAAVDIVVVRPVLDTAGIAASAYNAWLASYLGAYQSGANTVLYYDSNGATSGGAIYAIATLNNYTAAGFNWGFNAY